MYVFLFFFLSEFHLIDYSQNDRYNNNLLVWAFSADLDLLSALTMRAADVAITK